VAVFGAKRVFASRSRDSTLIMQLLRDNLTLWTSDMDSESLIRSASPVVYAKLRVANPDAEKEDAAAPETKAEPSA
jgi:hypothetical protein